MADTPIAIYREHLLQVRRVLELYPDRVHIRANWRFGGQYEQAVRLANLRPQAKEFWVRQRLFKRALMVASLGLAAIIVFTRPGYQVPDWLMWTLYVLTAAAATIAVLAFPKVRFARFPTTAGKPGLDIARAGPDAGSFQEFITKVEKQIRRQ